MSRRTARVLLGVLAAGALVSGVWATVGPRSFYDDFPGFGFAWVRFDPPYNEHLVRDFGGLNLALAVFTIAAWQVASRAAVRVAGIAWLAFTVPHLVYHSRNREVFPGHDRPLVLSMLAAQVILAAVLALLPVRAPVASTEPAPR